MSFALDRAFIESFIQGALATMSVQCQVQAKLTRAYARKNGDSTLAPPADIAGIIGVTSKEFTGSISLCFPTATFLNFMGNMLGEKYAEITTEIEDGAGELTNIVYGCAKRVLNDKGYTLEKALPTVIRGNNLQIRHQASTPILVLPFESAAGAFYIEIGIEPTSSNTKRSA